MEQKNKISPSHTCQDKINYIMTVCLYCWHLWLSNAGRKFDHAYLSIVGWLAKIVTPRRYHTKIQRHLLNTQEAIAPMFWDIECGQNIRIAKNLMYHTCAGYLAFPFALAAGITSTIIGWNTVFYWNNGIIKIVTIILLVVFIAVGLSKLTKSIDNPQDYLPNFREFEKQDKEWHRKWKRNTILLFLGSIVSAAMSFGFGLLCIDIDKSLRAPM